MDQSSLHAAVTAAAPVMAPLAAPAGVPVAPVAEGGLSLWGLFFGSEPIIMFVMILLIAASFWSWTIIIQKVTRIRKLNAAAEQFEEAFWSGGALDDLYDRIQARPQDPLSAIFCAAMREWRRSVSKGLVLSTDVQGTLHQRIERVMQLTLSREMDHLEKHMGILASTGSTAPFIGLFGTVLGIMNCFQSIGAQQNTTLAVVAPGMAEALFATAIGLVAAIPASVGYNKISGDLSRYANRLDAFANEFGAIISRQLEEQAA